MKKALPVVSICLMFLSIPLWSIPAQTTTEREIVAQVIRDNIGWVLTKDRPLLESTMAQDERLFIFNPESGSTAGWEQFAKNFDFWLDPRFKATGLDIRDLRIDFSPLGDAAWWSCILDDLYEWDGKAGAWKDTRWTGVLEKRDGKWRIVQMHFSFAADKVTAEVKDRLARGASSQPEAIGSLDPRLKLIEPLVNRKWTGLMKAPDGSASWKSIRIWEIIWKGKAIKYSNSVPELNSYEEGFIYWDDIIKKPAFFSLHSRGVYQSGFISADKNVINFEGKMTWPTPPSDPGIKQSYDFKNTFEFVSPMEMVDKWFQNAFGPWQPGHIVAFTSSPESKDK